MRCNGYPDWILRELDSHEEKNKGQQTSGRSNAKDREKTKQFPVVIPYIKGFSEEVRRVFGNYNIPTYFKPANTLRQLLVRPKDPVEKEKVVGPVYRIQCEMCDASYIGETERSLKARFSEHRRPSSSNSEVAKHIHTEQPDHNVKMENTRILKTE